MKFKFYFGEGAHPPSPHLRECEGGWEVDHIRPCASFDLTDTGQQKECFHWTNLQPLWELDNDRKDSWYNGVRHVKGLPVK